MEHMDVSENSGTPKSSVLIGFSIINHPFWGSPIFGNTHMGYLSPVARKSAPKIPPSLAPVRLSQEALNTEPVALVDAKVDPLGNLGPLRRLKKFRGPPKGSVLKKPRIPDPSMGLVIIFIFTMHGLTIKNPAIHVDEYTSPHRSVMGTFRPFFQDDERLLGVGP